jgi:AraC-like DNA-binding protein
MHTFTTTKFNKKMYIFRRQNLSHQKFLERLSSLILEEMATGRLSIEKIASEMYVTRGQLTRRVKAITGLTYQQYAMKIRLKSACGMLSNNPEMMITEIAYKCGFEDATSFSRAFRRLYGMSPSMYRNEHSNG